MFIPLLFALFCINFMYQIVFVCSCCSYVGMIGYGKQPISLKSPSCIYFPVIVHEIGHAIGFYHEQSRPDRDDYVDIHEENILPGRTRSF